MEFLAALGRALVQRVLIPVGMLFVAIFGVGALLRKLGAPSGVSIALFFASFFLLSGVAVWLEGRVPSLLARRATARWEFFPDVALTVLTLVVTIATDSGALLLAALLLWLFVPAILAALVESRAAA